MDRIDMDAIAVRRAGLCAAEVDVVQESNYIRPGRRRAPIEDTTRSVVRYVTKLGVDSGSCSRYPVSVPRVGILEER